MINTTSFSSQEYRTFIVQDQSTQTTKVIYSPVIIQSGMFHLMSILKELLSDLKQLKIRVYDFSRDLYTEIDTKECLVPISFMINNPQTLMLLKINRKQEQSSLNSSGSSLFSQESDAKSENSSIKKERSKQRVIFEVIEIVKKWRELHYAKNDCKKKSLLEAAQLVGLPKKSLDDYYYQLRLGEKYDFNFKAHLFDRIGILRNFLKNIKQSPLYDKSQKHPKKLKILDDFQSISQDYKNGNFQLMKEQVDQNQNAFMERKPHNTNQSIRRNTEEIYQEQMSQEENREVYNNFFNQFQYMMNQKDPFLSSDYNFKKKNNEDDYFQF